MTDMAMPRKVGYPHRFRTIITLYYVTISVILLSFCLLGVWGATGAFGSADIVLLIFMASLMIGGTPILVVISLFTLVVSLRYLVLDRLSGRLRMVAIVTSIISAALAVACGLYFSTIINNI